MPTSMRTQREATAIHESGHALLALMGGIRVKQATIRGGRGYNGCVTTFECDDQPLRPALRMIIAGPLAEGVFNHGSNVDLRPDWDDCGSKDAIDARRIALRLAGGSLVRRDAILAAAVDEVFKILQRPAIWSALVTIAGELLERNTLDGEDLQQIVETLGLPCRRPALVGAA